MARTLFGAFVLTRVFHAVFYLGAKQPFRTIAFGVGALVSLVMTVQVLRVVVTMPRPPIRRKQTTCGEAELAEVGGVRPSRHSRGERASAPSDFVRLLRPQLDQDFANGVARFVELFGCGGLALAGRFEAVLGFEDALHERSRCRAIPGAPALFAAAERLQVLPQALEVVAYLEDSAFTALERQT